MSITQQIALGSVVGLLVGLTIGWLLRALRPGRVEEELRAQRAAQESELIQLRSELTSVSSARAAADATRSATETALNELRAEQQQMAIGATEAQKRLESELREVRESLTNESIAKGSIAAELTSARADIKEMREKQEKCINEAAQLNRELLSLKQRNGQLESQVQFLNERLSTERQQIELVQEKFRKEFEAVSNRLLLDSSSRFNQQSSESLEKLLSPLKETLGQFKTSLDITSKETATYSALLKEQIGRVGTEAANLTKALKGDVKVLGNWGENMLDQILVKSGLQLGVHYRRQSSGKDSEGDQRFLDVIIDLPEGRNLVIDSKVSLRSYADAVNCPDESGRSELLERHAEALRAHFRGLGGKRYHDTYGISSPDFVLMYIPVEAAFFAAISHTPGLFEEAFEEDVVLITNSTLLATLRTVANVWRLADQQKHALEIADRGGKLYDKFVGFVEDLQEVGKALKNGQDAWEGAWNKLHTGAGNLVRQAEQLKILGAKAAKALPAALVEEAGDDRSAPAQISVGGVKGDSEGLTGPPGPA